MHELGQKDEALPLMSGSNIYGGEGSDEVGEVRCEREQVDTPFASKEGQCGWESGTHAIEHGAK